MWKKISLWFKKFWYVPILVLFGAILFFVSRGRNTALLDVIDTQRDAYREELEARERIRREAEEKKKKIQEQYEETLTRLARKYEVERDELEDRQLARAREIVEEHADNPSGLSDRLAREFGLTKIE